VELVEQPQLFSMRGELLVPLECQQVVEFVRAHPLRLQGQGAERRETHQHMAGPIACEKALQTPCKAPVSSGAAVERMDEVAQQSVDITAARLNRAYAQASRQQEQKTSHALVEESGRRREMVARAMTQHAVRDAGVGEFGVHFHHPVDHDLVAAPP
jgi:hypothetical protein